MTKSTKLTIAEMKRLNESINHHWFDKDTMEFFNTKIEAQPNKDNIFITSDFVSDFPETKGYALRKFDVETNEVRTLGGILLDGYPTLAAARAARKEVK